MLLGNGFALFYYFNFAFECSLFTDCKILCNFLLLSSGQPKALYPSAQFQRGAVPRKIKCHGRTDDAQAYTRQGSARESQHFGTEYAQFITQHTA